MGVTRVPSLVEQTSANTLPYSCESLFSYFFQYHKIVCLHGQSYEEAVCGFQAIWKLVFAI